MNSLARKYAESFENDAWTDERLSIVERAHDQLKGDGQSAWRFLEEVFDHTPVASAQYVGADLLEDFIVLHGRACLNEVVARADRDAILFAALRCVQVPQAGEDVWRAINDYLRTRGVPESTLMDWSDYQPPDEDLSF